MKISLTPIAGAIALAITTGCAGPGPRSIEMPYYEASNTKVLDIYGVELTDSCTILSCHVEYRPGWWIQVDSASVLVANGKKYSQTGAVGIPVNEHYFMPDSGSVDYKLIFEPIPFNTESIDYVNDVTDDWAIWGIDVSGRLKKTDLRSKLPAEVRKSLEGKLDIKQANVVDSTTVNLHISGYRPGLGTLEVMVYSPEGIQTFSSVKPDEHGDASINMLICGTSMVNPVFTQLGMSPGGVLVAPDETTDIYVDASIMTARGERLRLQDEANPAIYTNGRYAPLNCYMDAIDHSVIDPFDGTSFYLGMGAEEFTDSVLALHARKLAAVDTLVIPEAAKEYARAAVDYSALTTMSNALYSQVNSYYRTHPFTPGVNLADSVKELPGTMQYMRVYQKIAASEPIFMAIPTPWTVNWDKIDTKYGRTRNLYSQAYEQASQANLTDPSLIEALKANPEPFFYEAACKTQAKAKADLERSRSLTCAVPDVPAEKLFEAIVASHKGKVVLVDLWNTWCSPCRAALKANEPLKSGELDNEDIVWIYIADTSSSMDQYNSILEGIKGLHYLVDEDQINTIRSQFDVDGIPFYILVDRTGKASPHPDFRDHTELIKGIKAAL